MTDDSQSATERGTAAILEHVSLPEAVLLLQAFEMFTDMGMDAFSERTRRELAATGEKIRAQAADRPHDLTSQEAQIARLAREGLTNAEIGFQLYLSARTVEWHLRKVFAKLGITSRRQLHTAVLL